MSYMLDTDICIYLLTDRAPEKREQILSRQPDAPLLLSAITVSELSYGVQKSKWRGLGKEGSAHWPHGYVDCCSRR